MGRTLGAVGEGGSAQDSPPDNGKTTIVAPVMRLGIPPLGGSNMGGGAEGSGGAYHENSEYGCSLYFDADNSVPLA